MIKVIDDKYFVLETAHTTYVFGVGETGHLRHLYYGKKITVKSVENVKALMIQQRYLPGNTTAYSAEHKNTSLEDVRLEVSSFGKGDTREPMMEIVSSDGVRTSDFVFEAYVRRQEDCSASQLPYAYDSDENIMITLRDRTKGYLMELNYSVFEKCDVITRSARFVNTSRDSVRIERLLSMQLDMDRQDMKVSSFTGGWTNEMNRHDVVLEAGKYVLSSNTGASSNRCNPFFMVSSKGTDEDNGDVFAFNLIYSGNHYEVCEVSPFGRLRIANGINPTGFNWEVDAGRDFETPQSVLCFSDRGYNSMSRRMHEFVRKHVVRGNWRDKERPILLNSWEANYFDIDENNLLALAKKAKEVGVELFVMDDGWFGERDDDTKSLGDWYVYEKKLPGGLARISQKINNLGLDFGIWIEPEMVNCNSRLYETHPEWTMEIPGVEHSEGRNQRLLDFANPEVVSYMTKTISGILKSANISYVKWDYNRNFSDVYSRILPPENQGEVAHRYILGLYRMMQALCEEFPDILFEGCASGGNRFDLGILSYFPQIWTSDNTDAVCRLNIQNGASYGYPMSVCSAHVSGIPNHQTLRITPLAARFAVAAFGVLGYECNLMDMKKDDLEDIRQQISFYKKFRRLFFAGTFYRHRAGNIYEWSVVSKDRNTAIGMVFQREMQPGIRDMRFTAKGLRRDRCYHFFSDDVRHHLKVFGDLVNTVTPVHIRQDSIAHNILNRHVPMTENGEDEYAYGDALMNAGISLHQGYVGTGFDDHIRVMRDFDARLYIMQEYK